MAKFVETKLFLDSILETRKCYLVNGDLTIDDVKALNNMRDSLYLVMENTKGQNSNVIGLLDSKKINISVVGGIDYLNKRKYALDENVMRTIYTPSSLSNIISIFEEIERNINVEWTDAQKCMYVYRTIVEGINYSNDEDEEIENDTIVTTNLNGLLYRKANYLGLALIFKEAMDRLGIESYYQSNKDKYSWNVVRVGNEYRVIDISWEVCNKVNDGKCSFRYFCRLDSSVFYNNPHHDISDDTEEIHFPAIAIEDYDLLNDINTITNTKYKISGNMIYYKNNKDEEFYYFLLGESNGYSVYIVRFKDFINYFYLIKGKDIKDYLDNNKLAIACSNYSHCLDGSKLPDMIKRFSRYMRKDGTNFLVCYSSNKNIGNVKCYLVMEPYIVDGKNVLIRSKIYSENNLVDDKDSIYKNDVANVLLSSSRLKNRLENYSGYVGYISEIVE